MRIRYILSLVKMLKPEELKERMEEEGPLYQYCQEVLDFYYDMTKL